MEISKPVHFYLEVKGSFLHQPSFFAASRGLWYPVTHRHICKQFLPEKRKKGTSCILILDINFSNQQNDIISNRKTKKLNIKIRWLILHGSIVTC